MTSGVLIIAYGSPNQDQNGRHADLVNVLLISSRGLCPHFHLLSYFHAYTIYVSVSHTHILEVVPQISYHTNVEAEIVILLASRSETCVTVISEQVCCYIQGYTGVA